MTDRTPTRTVSRRRVIALAATALAGTAALAACSSPAAPAAQPTTAAAQPAGSAASQPTASQPTAAPAQAAADNSTAAVTLYWDTFRGIGTPWPQHMIDRYVKLYPNRKIVLRPIPVPTSQQEAYPKMYAMYAAGTLGDNIAFDPSHWEFYRAVPQGILRPLDDYVSQDKLDLTQWYKPFMDMQSFKGKLWGLPSWGWSGYDGLHFNDLMLQEAGITLPDFESADWTMDKVREIVVKLFKKTGNQVDHYGIDLGLAAIGVTTIARAYNYDIISDDGKKALLTDAKNQSAMQWIWNLCQQDKVVSLPGSYQGANTALFASGKVACIHGGSLSVFQIDQAIKDPKLAKLKSVLFPKRSDGKHPSQLRGGTWNVNSKSKHPYEAWQFINILSDHEGILLFNTEGGNGALTRPDVMTDKFFTANANFKPFVEDLLTAIPAIVPANARGTEYENTFAQSFAEFYLGKSSYKDALAKAQDAVQHVLDEPMT